MGMSLGIQIYAYFKIGNCPECPQFKIRHTPPVPVGAGPDWLTWFEGNTQWNEAGNAQMGWIMFCFLRVY